MRWNTPLPSLGGTSWIPGSHPAKQRAQGGQQGVQGATSQATVQLQEQHNESFPSMPSAQTRLASEILKSCQHLQPTSYAQPFPMASGFSDTVGLSLPNSTRRTWSFKSSLRNYKNTITDLTLQLLFLADTTSRGDLNSRLFFYSSKIKSFQQVSRCKVRVIPTSALQPLHHPLRSKTVNSHCPRPSNCTEHDQLLAAGKDIKICWCQAVLVQTQAHMPISMADSAQSHRAALPILNTALL